MATARLRIKITIDTSIQAEVAHKDDWLTLASHSARNTGHIWVHPTTILNMLNSKIIPTQLRAELLHDLSCQILDASKSETSYNLRPRPRPANPRLFDV